MGNIGMGNITTRGSLVLIQNESKKYVKAALCSISGHRLRHIGEILVISGENLLGKSLT